MGTPASLDIRLLPGRHRVAERSRKSRPDPHETPRHSPHTLRSKHHPEPEGPQRPSQDSRKSQRSDTKRKHLQLPGTWDRGRGTETAQASPFPSYWERQPERIRPERRNFSRQRETVRSGAADLKTQLGATCCPLSTLLPGLLPWGTSGGLLTPYAVPVGPTVDVRASSAQQTGAGGGLRHLAVTNGQ